MSTWAQSDKKRPEWLIFGPILWFWALRRSAYCRSRRDLVQSSAISSNRPVWTRSVPYLTKCPNLETKTFLKWIEKCKSTYKKSSQIHKKSLAIHNESPRMPHPTLPPPPLRDVWRGGWRFNMDCVRFFMHFGVQLYFLCVDLHCSLII